MPVVPFSLSDALMLPDPPAAVAPATSADAPATPADAPLKDVPESPWTFSVTPYLWLAAMNGNMNIKGVPIHVDVNLSETVDLLKNNLNMAIALHFEAQHEHLGIFADGMYLGLEGSRQGQLATQTLHINEGIFEVGFAYADDRPRIKAGEDMQVRLEPIIGTRIWYLDGNFSTTSGLVSASGTATWADVFAGLRGELALSPHFSIFGRGDVGGGGSGLTWNAMAGLEWNICQPVGLLAGFRALSVDYTQGSGRNQFDYDMLLWGPFMALEIRF